VINCQCGLNIRNISLQMFCLIKDCNIWLKMICTWNKFLMGYVCWLLIFDVIRACNANPFRNLSWVQLTWHRRTLSVLLTWRRKTHFEYPAPVQGKHSAQSSLIKIRNNLGYIQMTRTKWQPSKQYPLKVLEHKLSR